MKPTSRTITIEPGWHRCHPKPSEDYGVKGARMVWKFERGDWYIAWDILTDWGLPDKEFRAACPDCPHRVHENGYPPMGRPMAGPVVWHSPVPIYDDDLPARLSCDELNGAPCYRDTGYLLGDDLWHKLRTGGSDAVWAELETLLVDRQRAAAKYAKRATTT